ncbi:MBL fold metallo-hydrolase [Pacificimonas sp. WHA3]|uniref:MBL fold metallo-hydrolase n=1 Tax=Pacificimonas pallii TaxID=2827236 RepID=A0ABS6SEB9_9SPHN|nr:MBL fold metallo-hydrolase [Pacificimonas pallii]MBV7256605.1 MBL fold metallo-hydrolase [Pacificimonas pallii]
MPGTDRALERASSQIRSAGEDPPLVSEVVRFFDEDTFTASYIVRDPATTRCAVIDPVLGYDPASGRTSTGKADEIVARVEREGWHVEWILETHAHADHLSAAPHIQKRLGGTIGIGAHITEVQHIFAKLFNLEAGFSSDGSEFGHLFDDGEQFRIGEMPVTCLHVPGHTPACMAYVIGDAAFVGDTLFMPDYGTARADFPGGDAATLFRSIRRLLALPPDTRVFLCHDYKAPGRDIFVTETTIAAQHRHNIHVHDGVTEEDFVAMRTKRDADLDLPRLILPSVQVNIRAGHLPPAESNGTRYLKIPIDKV